MELMLTKEVGVEVSLLEEAGFEVVLASASGEPFVGTKTTVVPDLKLADVKAADYAGMIIACMAAGVPGEIPAEAVEIVSEVVAEGKPLAAQYGSLFILQRAGVLEGKKYAFEDARFSEGIYSGTGVVQDGNLITSGTCPYQAFWTGRPDGTRKLTQMFIDALARP